MVATTTVHERAQVDLLGDRIGQLAAELTVGEHRLIRAIGEFDVLEGWATQGALTYAQWLSWKIGLGAHAAREKIRVARKLRNLPEIDGAFADGRLSYSKVRALTRIADADTEASLLQVALSCTAQQLERLCRRFARVVGSDDAPEPERFVHHEWSDEGALRVTIQLPADEGARLLAAIEAGREADGGGGPTDVTGASHSAAGSLQGNHEQGDAGTAPAGARATMADGLMVVAESFLVDGARPRRGGAPHEVVLHVPAGTLEAEGEGAFVESHDGPAIAPATARRIACDASVTAVTRGAGGEILDVGRKTRTVPAGMRRALEVRDNRACSFPGCTRTLFLDAHHVRHWADGGETKLSNLVLLCSRCHHFVHEHGYTIESDARGRHRVFTEAGVEVARVPEPQENVGPFACDVPAGTLDPDVLFLEPVPTLEVIDAICADAEQVARRRLVSATATSDAEAVAGLRAEARG